MRIALTREISPLLAQCELTHLDRQPIDLDLARAQHGAYEACLAEAGYHVERLPAGVDMPDSVFIEDTAVVFPELAIITRPGAASRRHETTAVAAALAASRRLVHLEPPATMDGGDVLVVRRSVFVGRSGRTNDEAVAQMSAALREHGYQVTTVDVRGCLHLKSAVTALAEDVLLVNPAWLPGDAFAAFERVRVHSDEPWGANALLVGDHVIYPTSFPRTLDAIARRRIRVRTVEATEVAKAEGAVTCCSLLFEFVPNESAPTKP